MCDFFWQRMENDQGDLADIVRAGGRGSPLSTEFPNTNWQLPSEPMTFPPSTEGQAVGDFGDPFADLRDPLLDQLVGSEFFDGPSTTSGLVSMSPEGDGGGRDGGGSSGLGAQNMMVSAEMRRPCNIFSRVLQISPGTGGTSPLSPRVIKPSPVVAGGMMKVAGGSLGSPVDPSVRVQISSPRTPGIKRRKSLAKKVVCIPAPAASASSRSSGEVVPSDLWAWRKYGQKPIKGSPYPRNYYRCSSSKGCSARKQVERSRTDPNMLVITYTSEHNHPWPTQRNALAGSTRSQSSKNSSSASKNSPHKRKPPTSHGEEYSKVMTSSSAPAVKGEAREMGKAIDSVENGEFDQLFQQSYKPMIPESNQPNDFFADLAELETDPMSLIFSKGSMETKPDEERGERALDPFNLFDWAGNSFEEAKKGL